MGLLLCVGIPQLLTRPRPRLCPLFGDQVLLLVVVRLLEGKPLVVLSLLVSGTILLVRAIFPGWGLADAARGILTQIDFSETLLLGLLTGHQGPAVFEGATSA